jgi:putative membrane protein
MSHRRARWVAGVSAAVLAAVPAASQAQGTDGNGGGSGQQQTQQQTQALQPIAPQEFVTAASQSNAFEIRSSRLVRTSSRNRDVRRIATLLIRHHTEQQQQLAAIAGQLGLQVPSSTSLSAAQTALVQRIRSRAARTPARDRAYLNAQVTAHEQAILLHERVVLTAGTPAPLQRAAVLALPLLGTHLGQVTLARTNAGFATSGSSTSGSGHSGSGHSGSGS